MKISVVVPIYNVEKYLEQCLDSILGQTYRDIEVICVNDGSTDRSAEILTEYESKDSRITVITQTNQGLGNARNRGFQEVSGEYVVFFDSDDWCRPDYFEKALMAFQKDAAIDLVMVSAVIYDEKKAKYVKNPYYSFGILKADEFEKNLTLDELGGRIFSLPVVVWNKIIKVSFLKKKKILFVEGKIFEDNLFSYEVYFQMKKFVAFSSTCVYYRINRDHSLIKSKGEKYFDILDILKKSLATLICLKKYQEFQVPFWYSSLTALRNRNQEIDENLQEDFYQKSRFWILEQNWDNRSFKTELILQENVNLYRNSNNYQEFIRRDRKTLFNFLYRKRIRPMMIRYFILGIPVYWEKKKL